MTLQLLFFIGENHKPTITNQWIWDLEHPCGTPVFSMVKGLSSSDDFIRSYPWWTVDVPNFHALRPNFRCKLESAGINRKHSYPLVICYIAMENGPVEIVDLLIENGDFP